MFFGRKNVSLFVASFKYNSWHNFILEDFQQELIKLGFDNPKIQYSGFWSQGDGLSFDADINVEKFAETVNEKRITKLIDSGYLDNFTIQKTSFANHYSHEKTRFVDYSSIEKTNIDRDYFAMYETLLMATTTRLHELS